MTHEIHKSVEQKIHRGALIMGAVSIGGLVEAGLAAYERRLPDISDVISYHEDEGPSFVFYRGCGENYLAQAPLLHRKLGGYGSMLFEYQVQGRHSQKLIDQNIIKACKSDGNRDRVLVGTSMGLMNLMLSLQNPAVRAAIGKDRLRAIVSLQGITSEEDLQPGMQKAADISSRIPPLVAISKLWQWQRLAKSRGGIAHSEGTTDAEAKLHNDSSAYMPFPLVASQHRVIERSMPWAEGSLQMVVDENPRLSLHQIVPEYDGVANHISTKASLERAFTGLSVETITDERRPRGSHAEDIEFYEPLEELMMKLSGRSRSIAAAARNLAMYSNGGGLTVAA